MRCSVAEFCCGRGGSSMSFDRRLERLDEQADQSRNPLLLIDDEVQGAVVEDVALQGDAMGALRFLFPHRRSPRENGQTTVGADKIAQRLKRVALEPGPDLDPG